MAAGAGYVPMLKRDPNGNWVKYEANKPHVDWYVEGGADLLAETPYTTPYTYEHLNELKDVPLAMMVFHLCPFLDEGLQLAKMWHGPVTLDAVDNACHACISFSGISPEARKVNSRVASFIEAALERSCGCK